MMDIQPYGLPEHLKPYTLKKPVISDHTCQYVKIYGRLAGFWNLNNPRWAGWLSDRGPFPATMAAVKDPVIVDEKTGEITLTPDAIQLEEFQIQSIVRRMTTGAMTVLGLVEGSQRLADKLRDRLPSSMYHIQLGPTTHPEGSPKAYHHDRTIVIVNHMIWGVPEPVSEPYVILSTDKPPVEETEYLFGVRLNTVWSEPLLFVPVHLSYSTDPDGTDTSGLYSVKPAMGALRRMMGEGRHGRPVVIGGDFNFAIDKRGFYVIDSAVPIPLHWLPTELPGHWTPSTNKPTIFDGVFFAGVEITHGDFDARDIVDKELEAMLCTIEQIGSLTNGM